MKNLILIACVLICLQATGQSFEGTVTWRLTQTPEDASGRAVTSLTVKAKGTSRATILNGGMMNGMEMWYLDNSTKIMRIMRPQKMFTVVSPEAMATAMKAIETGKFTKTSETVKILNYTCTKYTGEIKTGNVTQRVSIWTTTELKDDQKVLAHNPDISGNPKLPEGVAGVPLKIEKVTGTNTFVMEVTEIKAEKLADDLFTVPSDFKEIGK